MDENDGGVTRTVCAQAPVTDGVAVRQKESWKGVREEKWDRKTKCEAGKRPISAGRKNNEKVAK